MIGFTNAKVFNTIEYNKDYENNNSNVYKITIVDYDGSINNTGEGWLLSAPTFGVRPAIWVDVSALEK